MSLYENFKRMLGFGESEGLDEALDTDIEQIETAIVESSDIVTVTVADDTVQHIFDSVIGIFNASLPDFLAKSVDPARQRQNIYNALDDSIKDYLRTIENNARQKCEQEWSREREALHDEAAELKRRTEELEKAKQENNDKRLSAERQKRAISDRLHDLEKQVLTLEAEKEQLELESKCMVNKTKAAAIMEEEIEHLRQENERLRNTMAADGADNSGDGKRIADLEAQNKSLNDEIAKLKTSLEAASVKDQMNGSMFADFQKNASEATKKAKESQAQAETLQQELLLKEAKIQDLQKALDEKTAQLDEGYISYEELEEIQEKINAFQEVKNKLDATIEKLRANLKDAKEENTTLQQTVKTNLLQQEQNEKALKAEIQSLKQQLSESSRQPAVAELEEYDGNIDDMLNGTDWLVSVPEKENSMRDAFEESDFGYQAPPKKNKTTHNDAQLSLFDL